VDRRAQRVFRRCNGADGIVVDVVVDVGGGGGGVGNVGGSAGGMKACEVVVVVVVVVGGNCSRCCCSSKIRCFIDFRDLFPIQCSLGGQIVWRQGVIRIIKVHVGNELLVSWVR
jgi:hypothetical protein